MNRLRISALLLAIGVSVPVAAWAQEAVVEGPGHEIGEGTVIHPAASVETGFISNVFYEDEDPVAAPILRAILSFAVASQNAQPGGEVEPEIAEEAEEEGTEDSEPVPSKLDWRLSGDITAIGYLSTGRRTRDQSDIGTNLAFGMVALPAGDLSFDLQDQFSRDTRPKNYESFGNTNRDINHLLVGARFKPGGGALQFGARYENTVDIFEDGDQSFGNRIQHLLGARAEWQLFPFTRLFLDASLGFFGGLGGEAEAYKSSSMPLRIQAAIASSLTEVTTIRAHVGYGNGFYSAGENFNMALFGAEFGYRYTEYGRFTIAYDYGFQDSINANFFRDHAFLAKVDHQFGLFVLGADGAIRLRGYRGIPPSIMASSTSRDDLILAATLRGHYLYRDWLAVTARLEAVSDTTDFMHSAGGIPDDPSYQRIEAVVGVVAAF